MRTAGRSAGPARRLRRAGPYDRAALARLYGGRGPASARGWTAHGRELVSTTLLSPYPDATFTTLDAGHARHPVRSLGKPRDYNPGLGHEDGSPRGSLVCALALCRTSSGARAGAAVRADVARRRPRDPQRRRVGVVRRAPTPGSSTTPTTSTRRSALFRVDVDGGGESRTTHVSVLGEVRTRERRTARRPYALLPAHPAVDRTATSTSRSGRVPPTFGAFARRTYAVGQPAHRLSARLPVPDVAAPRRAAGERRRTARACAGAAGCRATRSATRRRPPACRSSARSAGTPASRCTRRRTRRRHRVGHHRHAVESAVHGRQRGPPARRARSRCVRSPGLIARRVGRARPVRQRDGGARRRRRRPRRRLHADRLGRRRRVLARLLPGSRRNRVQRLAAAGGRRAGHRRAAARARQRTSKDATRSGPGLYAAARVDHLGFSELTGTDGTADVGRAGHAARGRRRLLDPAQPAAQGVRVSTTRATAAACTRARTWWRRSWCSGSDDDPRPHRTRERRGLAVARGSWPAGRACRCRSRLSCAPRRRGCRGTGSIRGRVELRRAGDAARAPAERRRPRHAAAHATCPIACTSVVYLESAPRGAFEQTDAGHAVMDQRNETFVPHVLAITTGTTVDFPEQRPHLPQRVLALEDAAASISAATPPATRSRSGSTARASCACSATSTRT